MKKLASVFLIGIFLLATGCSTIVAYSLGVPAGEPEQMLKEMNVMVPMRDGVKLATDIYRPKTPGKYPAIVCRLPYGSDGSMYSILAKFYVRHGYIFIVQDTRGTFSSEGTYFPLVFEYDDGHDTIDWVTKQSWYNGKIGAWGGSYFGYTQWEAAPDNPAITAMNPLYTSGSIKEVMFRGGATVYVTFVPWNAGMQQAWNEKQGIKQEVKVDLLAGGFFNLPIRPSQKVDVKELIKDRKNLEKGVENWTEHPGDIQDADALNFDPFYSKVSAPSLLIAGWYDMFQGPELNDFIRIRSQGKGDAKQTRIIVGPWTHGAPGIPQNKIFEQKMLDGLKLYGSEMLNWFDYWLKGVDNGAGKEAPLKIFVIGENQWRDEKEWPLARTKWTNYYLHSNGSANSSKGGGKLDLILPQDESADKFAYDPNHPAPTRGGAFLPYGEWPAGSFDQSEIENRPDVLVFVSEPLTQGVEVTGPVRMVLYAASDAKDTDFTAKLVDIYPDGKAYNLCDGIIRARYRESLVQPSALVPGKVYQYQIDLWATSNYFQPGHKIALEISSSNFPQFDRNTNCAGEGGPDCRKIARQVVYHNSEYPSQIILPVIPR